MEFIFEYGTKTSKLLYSSNNTNKTFFLNLDVDITYIYIMPIISLTGLILNIFTCITFSSSLFNLVFYRYLQIESFIVCFNVLFQVFRPFCFNRLSWSSKSYTCIFYINYLIYFTSSILELSCVLLHILSTISFYLIVLKNDKNKMLCLISSRLRYYKFNSAVIFIFSNLVFLYQYFSCFIKPITIIEVSLQTNQTIQKHVIYDCEDSKFKQTNLKQIIEILMFLYRDGFNIIILMIINFLIYLKLRDWIKIKSIFVKNTLVLTCKENVVESSGKTLQNQYCSKAKIIKSNSNEMNQLNKKLIIMILLGGINLIFGRIPILISFILRNLLKWDLWQRANIGLALFNSIAVLFVFISYMNTFFLYYYCNKRFKKVFKLYFVSKFNFHSILNFSKKLNIISKQ